MTAEREPFSIESWLLYRLWNVSQEAGFVLERYYSQQFGLDGEGWRAMAALATHAPISAKQLAGILDRSAVQVTRTLARLQALGLVSRRTDHRDKRRIVLRLTRKGREVFRRIVPQARAVEQYVLAGFNAGERRQLASFLQRMEKNVSAHGKTG